MKTIYIMGPEGSGKTTVSVGLSLQLKSAGYKVGYFKPIGYSPWPTRVEDEDALLLKDILEDSRDLKSIVPINIGPTYLSGKKDRNECHDRIFEAYEQIKRDGDFDVLLVGGTTSPHILASQGLDCISLADEMGAAVLLTSTIRDDFEFDRAFFYNKHLKRLGVTVLGNIINNIPWATYEKTRGIHKPIMEEAGHNVIGVIPSSSQLSSPTVKECQQVLGGEVLVGGENMDRRVDDIVVGTMTIEGALKYLRRSSNKALVIGGDRSDLALTALETSTSVLILTGGLYPNVKVLSQAEEKKVPVILVHYDTYNTIEKLHEVSSRIKPGSKSNIELASKNIESYCELAPVWEYIDATTTD